MASCLENKRCPIVNGPCNEERCLFWSEGSTTGQFRMCRLLWPTSEHNPAVNVGAWIDKPDEGFRPSNEFPGDNPTEVGPRQSYPKEVDDNPYGTMGRAIDPDRPHPATNDLAYFRQFEADSIFENREYTNHCYKNGVFLGFEAEPEMREMRCHVRWHTFTLMTREAWAWAETFRVLSMLNATELKEAFGISPDLLSESLVPEVHDGEKSVRIPDKIRGILEDWYHRFKTVRNCQAGFNASNTLIMGMAYLEVIRLMAFLESRHGRGVGEVWLVEFAAVQAGRDLEDGTEVSDAVLGRLSYFYDAQITAKLMMETLIAAEKLSHRR